MEFGVKGALRAIGMRRDVGITPYGIGRNGGISLLTETRAGCTEFIAILQRIWSHPVGRDAHIAPRRIDHNMRRFPANPHHFPLRFVGDGVLDVPRKSISDSRHFPANSLSPPCHSERSEAESKNLGTTLK